MMVYPEEPFSSPSIWTIPHIPALYDDEDYGGKNIIFKLLSSL